METKDNAHFHILLVKGWVKKEDKFLLARRSPLEVHAAGVWSIPGGKIETSDEPNIIQKTLRTEILEEVGIEIGDDLSLIYNNSFTRDDGAHVIGMTFMCNYLSGEAMPLEDTTEIKWLTLNELKVLDGEGIKPFLKNEIKELIKFNGYD